MLCFIRFVHIDFDIGLYSPFYLLHVGVEMWAGGEAYCPSVRQFGSERHAGATTGFVTHDSDIGQTAHLIDEIVGCAVGAAVGQHYCFLLPTYAVAGFQFYGVGFGESLCPLPVLWRIYPVSTFSLVKRAAMRSELVTLPPPLLRTSMISPLHGAR